MIFDNCPVADNRTGHQVKYYSSGTKTVLRWVREPEKMLPLDKSDGVIDYGSVAMSPECPQHSGAFGTPSPYSCHL